jgi:hypothetical protein
VDGVRQRDELVTPGVDRLLEHVTDRHGDLLEAQQDERTGAARRVRVPSSRYATPARRPASCA